ncbi:hypothetical protein D7V86_19325 [bacterium D16-51]|nr:hypothetical protein D7V96_16635 [bacterium D16-59]RKI56615.1 hypothetical protein D7V86_19325 [bacterium D16-51]
MHFIKLRACNCAQWEIRNISIGMLKHLRRLIYLKKRERVFQKY